MDYSIGKRAAFERELGEYIEWGKRVIESLTLTTLEVVVRHPGGYYVPKGPL